MLYDFSKPYTAAELDGLKDIFHGMSSYRDEGYALSSDIPAMCEEIGYDLSPEQFAIYKSYWDKHNGGIIPFSAFLNTAKSLSGTVEVARQHAVACDEDKSGFISPDEFEDLLVLLMVHD